MKILILLVSMVLTIWACAPKDSFSIKGEMPGLADGTVLELVPGATHKEEKPEAEAMVTNGTFSFVGKAETPRMYYIMVKGARGVISVIVENGMQVSIRGKAISQDFDGQKNVEFSDVQIVGSPVHDEYLRKMEFKTKLNDLFEENQKKHADVGRKLTVARMSKNQALLDSLTKTEAYARMSKDEADFFKAAGEQTKKAVMDNKDSWWGPFIMLTSMGWFEEEQKEWYEAFSPEAKNSYYGQIVCKDLYPEVREGKKALDFTVTDSQGKSITLQELREGKKYVIVDFWASWCGPCRKEIPNLKSIYERFSSKGLEIVSVSTDKNKKAWQKALDEEQLPWPNFVDESGIANAYAVKAIPAIFLLDANGTILSTKLRGEALKEKLEELLQ